MATLGTCDVCQDDKIASVSRVCTTTKAKVNSIAITACGASFKGCLSDSYAAWDMCSQDALYPALRPDGTAHPSAGLANPTAKTLTVAQQVKGDIYVPGDTEETELDYSCAPSVVYGDTSFEVTIQRLYQLEDEEFYCNLSDGNFGEFAVTDQDGLGYIVTSPTIKVSRNIDGDAQVVDIVVKWSQTSSYIKSLQVAAPFFVECD